MENTHEIDEWTDEEEKLESDLNSFLVQILSDTQMYTEQKHMLKITNGNKRVWTECMNKNRHRHRIAQQHTVQWFREIL